MAKRTTKDKEPGFEEALAELEQLVEAMEQDQLPLETLVEHYEKGSRLLARCEAVLKSARERLELITLEGADGGDDADGDDQPDARNDAPAQGEDDEIRLF
jgi:exodeoxyribonuclease VII small subunit